MCNVSLGKHKVSTKSEKHVFQSVVFICSLLFVFLRKSARIHAGSFIPCTKHVIVVGGGIHSQSFCADYCSPQRGVVHLPSVRCLWSCPVVAGAHGLKQLSKDKLKAKSSSVKAAGLAVVQDWSVLCRKPLYHNLDLFPCQIQPTPGIWRFLCSPSFEITPFCILIHLYHRIQLHQNTLGT